MPTADARIEELVSQIESGEVRLPEMQRRYVWQATRVRDLLDSLYRGYPSGAILLWETGEEDVPERDFAIEQQNNPYRKSKLLLDGQQRLTSLSSVIRGEPVTVRGRKRPIDILFNLEHPDKPFGAGVPQDSDNDSAEDETAVDGAPDSLFPDLASDEEAEDSMAAQGADATDDEIQKRLEQMTFVVATRKLESLPNWVSVTEVFKSTSNREILKKAGVENFDDPRYDKYDQRLTTLRNIPKTYKYRLDILDSSLSYEEVTEIFVRVNSLGAKLRGSDLALAQITAKWRDSLKIFENLQKEFSERGFDADIGIYVRALVCFATRQSQFHSVHTLEEGVLQEGWRKAKEGLEYAINYLKDNIGIDSTVLLSSPYLIIALAAYGFQNDFKLPLDQEKELRRWTLVANAKGRYSRGSSESLLDQDLAAIFRGNGVKGMLDNLKQQFGRLEIEPEDLVGRTQRSGIFKTMFFVFKQDEAHDWHTGLVIAYNQAGARHKMQFHHIFPKAFLRGVYDSKQVNEIANLAFISSRTNRNIAAQAPLTYFKQVADKRGAEAFDLQCVPHKPELLELDAYTDFLAERRRLIANKLNEYIFS